MNTVSGVATLLKLFCLPSGKGVYSERKDFAPFGANSFPLIVDPFSEEDWYAGRQNRKSK